jgi:hypothetical protein
VTDGALDPALLVFFDRGLVVVLRSPEWLSERGGGAAYVGDVRPRLVTPTSGILSGEMTYLEPGNVRSLFRMGQRLEDFQATSGKCGN